MTDPFSLSVRSFVAVALCAALSACGSSGTTDVSVVPSTVTPPPVITATAIVPMYSGSLTATVGTAVPIPLGVRVTSASGSGMAGAAVAFVVTAGAGTVSPTTASTDATGFASATWTMGKVAGPAMLTATTGTLSASFNATAKAGPTSALTIVAGNNQSAFVSTALPTRPSVKAADAYGNPVPDVAVLFAVGANNGSVSPGVATTNADGIATGGSWTLGASTGVQSLTATDGQRSATFTATALAIPVPPVTTGTLVIASAPDLPIGAFLSGTIAGPAGFATESFLILQPGARSFSNLPLGTYTIAWSNAYGGNPVGEYRPSPTQSTKTLSTSSPVDTARVQWTRVP
jgi:hypothetical protein